MPSKLERTRNKRKKTTREKKKSSLIEVQTDKVCRGQTEWTMQFNGMEFTLTYATGGISARRPVNMVTSVSMHVTNSVTRPGIASKPSQNENHDSITTSVDGANVWIKWWPIWRSKRKLTVRREKLPEIENKYGKTKRKIKKNKLKIDFQKFSFIFSNAWQSKNYEKKHVWSFICIFIYRFYFKSTNSFAAKLNYQQILNE